MGKLVISDIDVETILTDKQNKKRVRVPIYEELDTPNTQVNLLLVGSVTLVLESRFNCTDQRFKNVVESFLKRLNETI